MATLESEEHTPTSFELWAASKIIGRECSTINKDFFLCKKANGLNPNVCEKESKLVTSCTSKIIRSVKEKFPTEFTAFQKCLDYNDYRY
jgi:hypothetical protein